MRASQNLIQIYSAFQAFQARALNTSISLYALMLLFIMPLRLGVLR